MNDGGLAFPKPTSMSTNRIDDPDWRIHSADGMTLRDWFAGQALSGIISAIDVKTMGKASRAGIADDLDAAIVKSAYGCADAMIAERDKEA